MHLMYFGEEPAPADEWAPAGSAPPQALDPPAPLDDPDEGRHHQLPLVHAQVAPQQKPHPRVWIAGTGEPEMVAWAARRAYPYVCIDTGVEGAQRAGQVYDDAVVAAGHAPGPEHRGYVVRCHVQDTAEKALESARRTGPRGRSMVICGTPEQCVRSLRSVVATLRPGILAIWANAGAVSHADSMRGIEFLGTEVMPAVREFARECGVRGPFDGDVPAGRPPAAEA